MSEPILTTHNLTRKFDNYVAVDHVSFSIAHGEIFSLLGPNGAGKTTTISMLSCLIAPTSGDAEVDGHSITANPNGVKNAIGVVPQEIALYDTLTARQNLSFWGHMSGMSGKPLKARIDEVLEQVELVDRADDKVEEYSGGMKRRINIAVGLLHKPKLLFMDEPTVGIDPQSRRRILDMVTELRDQGMTVLYTTHYMEEAEELSDRVGIIDNGKLIALGTQKELTKLVGQQESLRLHLGEGMLGEAVRELFVDVEGVLQVNALNGAVILSVTEAATALPGAVAVANANNIRIRSVDIQEPNLEAVFLHLTGRALRD
jgi:ABC-2 type transport system ATP-binding protein